MHKSSRSSYAFDDRKNDKCHFIGEEIQNWFYRQKPQTLPDYFEVCMYFSLFWLFMHA